ncbi:hypothetical protein ACOMHN_050389 [Nucella lapillus]
MTATLSAASLRNLIRSLDNSALPPSAGIRSRPANQPLLGPPRSHTGKLPKEQTIMLPKERAILRHPLPLPRNPARVFGRATVPVNRGILRLRLAAGRPPPGAPGRKPPSTF